MQRTPNLGLPQFEPSDKYRLEDYNEAYMKIDEKVKELNDKEAQLDTKLAEAQSIIDTWTQFKNNGGSVGGSINANDKISLNGDEISFRSKKHNRGLVFNDKVTTIYDWGRNRHIFRVDETNSMSTVYANDFYFGQYSKNAIGYTKLPNGLILQWGNHQFLDKVNEGVFESTYSVRMPISFPIAFPNKILSFSSTSDRVSVFSAFSDVTNSSCTLFATSMVNANISVGIRWIAIGY